MKLKLSLNYKIVLIIALFLINTAALYADKKDDKADKKLEINMISLNDENLEDKDDEDKKKDKTKKKKDKNKKKAIVDIVFDSENEDNKEKSLNEDKKIAQNETKTTKNKIKNKTSYKYEKKKINKDNNQKKIEKNDSIFLTSFMGQIRFDFHLLVFHMSDEDEVDILETEYEWKILGGIGFEYLISDQWGILTAFGLGIQDQRVNENISKKRLLLDFHVFACYHLLPPTSFDVYLQTGFGVIFSNIATKTVDGDDTSYSVSSKDLKSVEYSIIGLGCNYFITENIFAGLEGQYILNEYEIKDKEEKRLGSINIDKFIWRAKTGFAF